MGFVRRRVPREELDLERDEDAAAALTTLVDRRLVRVDEEAVEVAHEALLREWPRLRGWLEDDAEGRRLHQHLIGAARDWEAGGRDPGELYRGARLGSTLDWAAPDERELNQLERDFLAASRAHAQLEAERERQANRRLRVLLAGVGALLALALAAGVAALGQRGAARHEAVAAEAQRLGAQALSDEELDRSLLLARQGVALQDSLTTRGNLLAALLRSPAAIGVLRGDGGRMLSVAVKPDGRTVVAGDNGGRVLAFDTAGRRLRASYRTGLPVRTLRFSPDGTRLAIASGHNAAGALDLVDAATLHRIAHRRLPAGPEFHTLAFSPDSRVLLTANARWGGRGMLSSWDSRTGRALRPPTPITGRDEDFLVEFLADGRRLVTMSENARETIVRDAHTLRPVAHERAWGLTWASAVSPDGQVAALARDDGSLRFLDLRTGSSRTPSVRHDGSLQSAGFSADGHTLVTGGDDEKVIVWDVRRGQPRATFQSHGRIAGVALSPDARTAYSASLDGTVTVWDVAGSRRLGRLFAATSRFKVGTTISESGIAPRNSGAYNVATTPDGATLAVEQPDGFVNLIDARTLQLQGRIRATSGFPALGVAFAPDGRTLAITAHHGRLRFWDARTRTPLSRTFRGDDPRASWWSPRFSHDGRWLVTGGNDAVVRLWDARRHVPVRKLQLPQMPGDMALRPDGRVLVVPSSWGPGQGSVEILAMPSLKRVARISIKYARIARFSSHGRLLILGDGDGRAQLYDGRTFRPLGRPLLGHAGYVVTADFSPDGRTVATSSADGTIRLWDTASSRLIGTPLPGVPNVLVGVAFIRGGTHIAAVYDSGQGYVWDVRPSSWARYACAVAGRALTRTEWDEALPGRQYAPACTTH